MATQVAIDALCASGPQEERDDSSAGDRRRLPYSVGFGCARRRESRSARFGRELPLLSLTLELSLVLSAQHPICLVHCRLQLIADEISQPTLFRWPYGDLTRG